MPNDLLFVILCSLTSFMPNNLLFVISIRLISSFYTDVFTAMVMAYVMRIIYMFLPHVHSHVHVGTDCYVICAYFIEISSILWFKDISYSL